MSTFLNPQALLFAAAGLLAFAACYLAAPGRDGKPRYPPGTNGRRLAKPAAILAIACCLSSAGTGLGWLVTAKMVGVLAVGFTALAILVLTTVAISDWVKKWLAKPSTKTGDHPGEENAIREAHRKLRNPR